MPLDQDKLQIRAVKAGIRAAKRTHHVPDEQELRKLKIQIVPFNLRLVVVIAGLGMLLSGFTGWPMGTIEWQAVLVVGGGFASSFGIFGVRRSLGAILDAMSAEGAGALIEVIFTLIGDALGS